MENDRDLIQELLDQKKALLDREQIFLDYKRDCEEIKNQLNKLKNKVDHLLVTKNNPEDQKTLLIIKNEIIERQLNIENSQEEIKKSQEEIEIIRDNIRTIENINVKSFKKILITDIIPYISFWILFYFFSHSNSKRFEMTVFLFSSNTLLIFISTLFYNYNLNFSIFFNIININILVLFLGFIYKIIFFSPLEIDFIYYFSIKDYLIIVFKSALILIYFIFISTIVEKLFDLIYNKFFIEKQPSLFFNAFIYFVFLALFYSLNFLFKYCLFNPLNINFSIANMVATFILIVCFYCIIRIYRLKNLNSFYISLNYYNFFVKNKVILLLLILMLFINSAFFKIYNIIGSSEQDLIKTGFKYKIYENNKIFKIDSSENYDFYISKPSNESLIFEKDQNIIKIKKD